LLRSNELQKTISGLPVDFAMNTKALWYMYNYLIKPVEGYLNVHRIIIIPDEEIGRVPFEAFIRDLPEKGKSDYEGLNYLINDYSFSYAYTSSQVTSVRPGGSLSCKVFTFSPEYSNKNSGTGAVPLEGAEKEISSIYKWFHGRRYEGSDATLTNFRQVIQSPSIFHLAMHSVSDTTNSSYSYLLFDIGHDTVSKGRFYNYEISLSRISSPMVVLSACNSGSGTLYQGEGLMSIARGFLLAGATSVVNTKWEINDQTSAKIISQYYFYLSRRKPKDEAMRLAKLDYLKSVPSVYSNPYYWAAYEVTGSVAPISFRNWYLYPIILGITVVLVVGSWLIYLRRRRIFSDFSR